MTQRCEKEGSRVAGVREEPVERSALGRNGLRPRRHLLRRGGGRAPDVCVEVPQFLPDIVTVGDPPAEDQRDGLGRAGGDARLGRDRAKPLRTTTYLPPFFSDFWQFPRAQLRRDP